MATTRKRYRLDLYAEPTPRRPDVADVADALYALQIEATDMDAKEIANTAVGAVLVALVKHLERAQGSWDVVEQDEATAESSRRRARIVDVTRKG